MTNAKAANEKRLAKKLEKKRANKLKRKMPRPKMPKKLMTYLRKLKTTPRIVLMMIPQVHPE